MLSQDIFFHICTIHSLKVTNFGHGIDGFISHWTTEPITNNKENCDGLASEFIGSLLINLSEL